MLLGGLVVCVANDRLVSDRILEEGDPGREVVGPDTGPLLVLGPATVDGGAGKAP